MKKTIVTLCITVISFITFSSCSKCTICTKSGGSEVRLCEKDYGSNTAYGAAIDIYTAGGYNCH